MVEVYGRRQRWRAVAIMMSCACALVVGFWNFYLASLFNKHLELSLSLTMPPWATSVQSGENDRTKKMLGCIHRARSTYGGGFFG